MSFIVDPSEGPGASSGSLLVIEVSTIWKACAQELGTTVAVTVTILWLAGFSVEGVRLTDIAGESGACEQPAAPPQTSALQGLPSSQSAPPPSSMVPSQSSSMPLQISVSDEPGQACGVPVQFTVR